MLLSLAPQLPHCGGGLQKNSNDTREKQRRTLLRETSSNYCMPALQNEVNHSLPTLPMLTVCRHAKCDGAKSVSALHLTTKIHGPSVTDLARIAMENDNASIKLSLCQFPLYLTAIKLIQMMCSEENQAARQRKHLTCTKSLSKKRTGVKKSDRADSVAESTASATPESSQSLRQSNLSEPEVDSPISTSPTSPGLVSPAESPLTSLGSSPAPQLYHSPSPSMSDYDSDNVDPDPSYAVSYLASSYNMQDAALYNPAPWSTTASLENFNADFYPSVSQTFEQSSARCFSSFPSFPTAYACAPHDPYQQTIQPTLLQDAWTFQYNPFGLHPQSSEKHLPLYDFGQGQQ